VPITHEDGELVFTSDAGPLAPLRHPAVAVLYDPTGTKLVAAIWQAKQVPYINGEVAYYLAEGVLHPTKSDYDYWHLFGLAGAVLKPHLRSRLGCARTHAELVAGLFPPDPDSLSPVPLGCTPSGEQPAPLVSEEEILHGI
jgi:hypothetical protein